MKTSSNIKKVLIVSPYFYPYIEWGGPVTATWGLARLLKKEGLKVEVLTTDITRGQNKFKSPVKIIDGIKIILAKSLLPYLAWKFRLFISIDQIVRGYKIIPNYDLVHFNDVFIFQNIILSLYCRKYGIPYVITPHGNLSFQKERSKSGLKMLFYNVFAKHMLEKASKIIAVSEKEKKYIDDNFPKLAAKTIFIPQVVFTDKYKSVDAKKRFGIPPKDKIILFMGRIYLLKGVSELVLGFERYLERTKRPATLILAGPDAGGVNEINGILAKSSMLKNKVVMTGEVSGDLKYSLLTECDLMCLLSKSESMPVTVLEAASFHKPLIISAECNLQDLVDSGGALLSTRNKNDISDKINKILNTGAYKRIGVNSEKWFNDNFNTDKVVKRYIKTYESCA